MKLSYVCPCEICWVFTLFCICTMLGGDRYRREGTPMATRKKRLTLDLELGFQRRLKVMAALKGISMREYCQTAIDRELTKDEANGAGGPPTIRFFFGRLEASRDELLGNREFQGDSVEFIREARQARDALMDGRA